MFKVSEILFFIKQSSVFCADSSFEKESIEQHNERSAASGASFMS